MTLNFDPSADFAETVDGTESVTLLRRGSTPGLPGTVVSHALRRGATTREATIRNRSYTEKNIPSDGNYTASDVTWCLPTGELSDAPRLGDVILDGDGRRWTILDVRRAALQTRWQCAARDVALAYRLDATIAVLKATYTKGDCGAAKPTWRTWRTGVRARIQPVGSEPVAKNQVLQTTRRCRIFVEEDLTLDHTHRIRGPDGTIYRIAECVGAERIGELQSIDAEVIE